MRYLPALLLTALWSVHGPARAQTTTAAGLLQQARQQEAAGQLERAADTYTKAAAAFHAAGNAAQEGDAYGHAAAASEKNADQLLHSLAPPAAPARPGVPPAPAAPLPLAASARPAPVTGPGPWPGHPPVGPAVAAAAPAQAPAQQWKVGDKVSVGAGHNAATIIAVNANGTAYRVHHERTEYPYNVDTWYWLYDVHAPNTPAQAAAAAAEAQRWKVGDKVNVGPKKLAATVIDKTKDGLYYRVHKDNTDYPNNVDSWYLSSDIHARDK